MDTTRQRVFSTDDHRTVGEAAGMTGAGESSKEERQTAGNDGRERQTKKKTTTKAASRKKPSRLLSQTKNESRDSYLTTKRESRDSHVSSNRAQSRAPQSIRDQQRLPQVYSYSSRKQ